MSEKYYLGISLGFNSSACIMSDRRGLIAAISEERLNGEKNTKLFPIQAINKCIELAGMDREYGYYPIESVGISFYETLTVKSLKRYLPAALEKAVFSSIFLSDPYEYINALLRMGCGIMVKKYRDKPDFIRVEHHMAHALSALCFYGEIVPDPVVYITCDGFGDGISGRIMNDKFETISSIRTSCSLGLIYQFVTGALGFTEHLHEGKITGLAAYGEPKYIDFFRTTIDNRLFGMRMDDVWSCFRFQIFDEGDLAELEDYSPSPIEDFDLFVMLKAYIYNMVKSLQENNGATREDIAASVQAFVEEEMTAWISRNIKKIYGDKKVNAFLAGGLFANVKLNQRIHELDIINSVYVSPPMGDEGTCLGAAFYALKNDLGMDKVDTKGILRHRNSIYLGTSPVTTYEEVSEIFSSENFKISVMDGQTEKACRIAEKLADNKIVCLFNGRMEFGPRALGNRSIMYHCGDASVNEWLNNKLSRTEFMPFAPFCRKEIANDLFKNVKGAEITAEYMTITFDATDEFKKDYPAACHVDGTVRPQLVDARRNPLAYEILTFYERFTGKKALINTSFNLHNNPIIESIETAVTSWVMSYTDVLVLGDLMIERR